MEWIAAVALVGVVVVFIRTGKVEGRVRAWGKRIIDLEEDWLRVRGNIAELRANDLSLEADILELRQGVAAANVGVASLRETYRDLLEIQKRHMDETARGFASLGPRFAAIERRLDALEDGQSGFISVINVLRSRVDDLEKKEDD